jgi:hypothetical protein
MICRVFWDVAQFSPVEVDRRFRGAYCLHHRPDDGGSTVRVRALKPWKECGKCEVGGGSEKKMYLILFRMKVLTKFAFALFAKATR